VVVCLEQGADLHIAQLMPLPLTVTCFSKIQIGFTFLVVAHLGRPGKRAGRRVCVCVCVCVFQLRVPTELHTPWSVGNRLRHFRRTDLTDNPAEQVTWTGTARWPARRLVSAFYFSVIKLLALL